MAYKDNISRLSRLTAILLKLQSNSSVSIVSLSNHFEVSKRTIYRDFDSLSAAGVPIVQKNGGNYSLMSGYNLPPVMFTESEANALIVGQKMMEKTKDKSLIKEFQKAVDKVKSVLRSNEKQKADFLAKRTIIGKNWNEETTSNYISEIQQALTSFELLKIEYKKGGEKKSSERYIEPFAIYHNTLENWVLIAWCRLRNEFRNFRIDRIQSLLKTNEKFKPHQITLEELIEIQLQKYSKA